MAHNPASPLRAWAEEVYQAGYMAGRADQAALARPQSYHEINLQDLSRVPAALTSPAHPGLHAMLRHALNDPLWMSTLHTHPSVANVDGPTSLAHHISQRQGHSTSLSAEGEASGRALVPSPPVKNSWQQGSTTSSLSGRRATEDADRMLPVFPSTFHQAPGEPITPAIEDARTTTTTVQRTMLGTLQALAPRHPRKRRESNQVLLKTFKCKDFEGGGQSSAWRYRGTARKPYDEEARRQVANTRRGGACKSCSQKRKKCTHSSNDEISSFDRGVATNPRFLTEPSVTIEILNLKLFRLGTTRNPALLQEWTASKRSSSGMLFLRDGSVRIESPRVVSLTQDVTNCSFDVKVARFVPAPGDTTDFGVKDHGTGLVEKYPLPPYYLVDMKEVKLHLRDFLRRARPDYHQNIVSSSESILSSTFQEAERFGKISKSELISCALIFWSATRLIERVWLICGEDLLGMEPIKGKYGPCRAHPSKPTIPASPRMDTQLDELVIQSILIPLGDKLLVELKRKILAGKREDEYEILLAMFLILNNVERVLFDVVDFADRVGLVSTPRANSESSLSQGYQHACEALLHHYHKATGGATPLQRDFSNGSDEFDAEQLAYLRKLQAEIHDEGSHFPNPKHGDMYRDELYFCRQLLLSNWQANMHYKGPIYDFTEDDFLCS